MKSQSMPSRSATRLRPHESSPGACNLPAPARRPGKNRLTDRRASRDESRSGVSYLAETPSPTSGDIQHHANRQGHQRARRHRGGHRHCRDRRHGGRRRRAAGAPRAAREYEGTVVSVNRDIAHVPACATPSAAPSACKRQRATRASSASTASRGLQAPAMTNIETVVRRSSGRLARARGRALRRRRRATAATTRTATTTAAAAAGATTDARLGALRLVPRAPAARAW